ncbi:cell adhesion molecule Dscam1-like [Ptychodera flava]|uniref:cell adhesion molecule Dscam1-like n=1 Tax=Ptychodera flava TaxID=63121 RepID=UPI003969D5F6
MNRIVLTAFLWTIIALTPVILGLSTTRSSTTASPAPIIGPHFIYQPPGQVDFANTQTGRVECSAYGEPEPRVRWVKQDGSAVQSVDGLLTVQDNGTLIFPPFEPDNYNRTIHSGIYRCIASNGAGSIVSRNVRVNAVLLQPYVVQVYDEYVMRSNTAVFKCRIPSFVKDYVTVTSWTRGATTIVPGDRYSILDNGELHIRHVRDEDAQTRYRCTTTHRLTGQRKTSQPARLSVHSKLSQKLKHFLALVGDEATPKSFKVQKLQS